ncbi:hypothetical protein [Devosia submarina]|uniref:hypothetical protein n=1 Tax=Devosia submarina TaxID=1173082 RepID=UPI00130070C3|nr:hypothetical protein [Devosia submarina]
MPLVTKDHALVALQNAWPLIVSETRQVLAGELHYQAMIYHALRVAGPVPLMQLGMNVKQWITNVTTDLFKQLDLRHAEGFGGGFEPIPDVVIFGTGAAGNWQRRSYEATLQHMLLAVEVKASERHKSRLRSKDIHFDIRKLAAHRDEVRARGGDFEPVMMIIDVAKDPQERMDSRTLALSRELAGSMGVSLFYVSPDSEFADFPSGGESEHS